MTTAGQEDALVRALRQARHLSQCQAVDLDRARLELAATQARATAFAAQQEAALLRVAALEQLVLGLRTEQARLATLAPVESADLHTQLAVLAQQRDEAMRLRQSLSWRVTRPLRALRQPRVTLRILRDRLLRRLSAG